MSRFSAVVRVVHQLLEILTNTNIANKAPFDAACESLHLAVLAMHNACLLHVACSSALRPVARPVLRAAPRMTSGASREVSTVVFGMGCFWAPQEAFESIPGVESARVGYASVEPQSSIEAPSYFSVCQGNGYTEAVEVTFNENLTSS